MTATALVAGARLGAACAYGGMLGLDATSRQVAQILESEQIDVSLVSWRDDAAAIRSTIIVDQSAHTRTIFFRKPGLVGAPPNAPSESAIAGSRVLLIDHYGGEGNTRAVEIARRNNVPIVADFERSNVPDWDNFFPLVDHLIISRNFATQLCGETSPAVAARALWNKSRAVVVVTAGAAGAFAFDGKESSHVAAFPTPIADTTGCGDVFHGVYAGDFGVGLAAAKALDLGERGGGAQSATRRRTGGHRALR